MYTWVKMSSLLVINEVSRAIHVMLQDKFGTDMKRYVRMGEGVMPACHQ